MKALIIIVIVIAIGIWVANEFVSNNESDGTITYYVEDIPSYASAVLVKSALDKSINDWETLNPELDFVLVDNKNADFQIIWEKTISRHYAGVTEIGYDTDVIKIGLGSNDGNGNWVNASEGMLKDILSHEIGHSLGLLHSADYTHLMYGTGPQDSAFSDLGLNIPQATHLFYEGYDELEQQYNSLQPEITRLQNEYDQFPKIARDENEYNRAMKVTNELNRLIEQQNNLATKMNCYPFVEDTMILYIP